MPPPPIRPQKREGEGPRTVPFSFAQPAAPGGDPWPEFIQNAYNAVQGQTGDPYGVYWNDIISALAGNAYGYDPQTGARIDTPSPEWQAAAAAIPPEIQAQAGENWTAQHRKDEFSGIGGMFGNIFTPAALTAVGFMGANAIGQLAGAGAAGAGTGAGAVGAADVGGSMFPIAATPGLTAPAGGAVGLVPLGTGGGGGVLGSLGAFLGLGGAGGGGAMSNLAALAPLLGPVISGGMGLIGAGMASNASKGAAQTQADAAREAILAEMAMYGQSRADLAPYREAGYAALGQLGALAQQPVGYYPYEAPAALDPGQYGFDPGQYQFDPGQYQFDPGQHRFDPNQYAFKPPTGEEALRDDPGYQFRLQQGQKALETSAAARGGLLSGGTLKGIQDYAQGLASQEYGNVYARRLGENQMGYARGLEGNQLGFNRDLLGNQMRYDRDLQGNQLRFARDLQGNEMRYGRDYQRNADEAARGLQAYGTNLNQLLALRGQRWNELAGLAGVGQTATNTTAGLGASAAASQANNITSAGAANAAGQVGAANAWAGGLQNVGNAAMGYLNNTMLQQQMGQQNTMLQQQMAQQNDNYRMLAALLRR